MKERQTESQKKKKGGFIKVSERMRMRLNPSGVVYKE